MFNLPDNAILVGSAAFFSDYPDFKPHDLDYISVVEENPFPFMGEKVWSRLIVQGNGQDLVYVKKQPKEKLLEQQVSMTDLPMNVGKFLVPAFINLIGLTIEDLPRLQPLIDQLDARHEYEKIIYDAYLYNGNFTLTQQQRDAAYNSYKAARSKEKFNVI